jgi:hypothetical protein
MIVSFWVNSCEQENVFWQFMFQLALIQYFNRIVSLVLKNTKLRGLSRELTIPIERLRLVGEVSVNFCG